MLKLQKRTMATKILITFCLMVVCLLGASVTKAWRASKDAVPKGTSFTSGIATTAYKAAPGQKDVAAIKTIKGTTVCTASGSAVTDTAIAESAPVETAVVETASIDTNQVEKKNQLIVTTAHGKKKKKKTSRAYMWLGVPYGKTKRWRAPGAPASWSQTLSCRKKKKPKGDKSLFVNVYKPVKVPEKTEKLPVMVFLHGGGNVGGSANRNFSRFVQETKVIVVSVEFRQGAFGWFNSRGLLSRSKQEKGGNFAMLDIKLALEWIQKNIGEFGGDSANVTLSGFSAGARDALNCVISPLMKGLFHKLISFSGGMTTCSVKEGRKFSNEKLAQVLVRRGRFSKKRNALKHVKRMSRKKLNKLLNSLTDSEINKMAGSTSLRLTNFPQCFRDGVVIPKRGFECVEWGGYNRVPMLIGSNNSEFANVSYKTLNRILMKSPKTFKNKRQFYKLLRKAKSYGSQLQSSFYLEKLASKFSVDPFHSAIYAYRFSWGEKKGVVGTDYAKYIGSIHGMDFDFLLGRYVKGNAVATKNIYNKSNRKGREALSSTMRRYVSNFLYKGTPNGTDAQGKTLARWNRWGKAGTKRIMSFSATKTKAAAVMTSRYIDRVKCKKRMRRILTKKAYTLFKKRILNDRFFM